MRINHNISSMQSQGALFANNRMVGKDLERLSTGLRINRSSDDAAGLSISEGLRTQVRGAEQARKNTMDGISALNIAEGAMNEIHNILQRQRELAVQSATATYSSTERNYMNQEFDQLKAEIDRVTKVTNFNKIKLLDSNAAATDQKIFINTGGDKLQVDANSSANDSITVEYKGTDTTAMGISASNVNTQTDSQAAITSLDNAIKNVSDARANIGAYVNRLESTINNLTVSATNQQAAESQVRDVDFAYQSSSFTKNQILTQSATAMLSQANATSQNVLMLIR